MAHFSSAIVTKAGIDLALGAAAGVQSIEFVKMVSGNGEYTEEEKGRDALRERSGLKSQMQEFPFNSVEITSEKTAVLKSIITNKELTDGYRITEIGVYARAKGTEGDGVLYSIALAIESDYLPPFVNPAEIIQEYYITVSDTAEISIVSNPGAYALAEDLEKLRKDVENTGLLEPVGGGNDGPGGDGSDGNDTFIGKMKDFMNRVKAAAFATIVNHCLTTEPGTVLDGRVGKILMDEITKNQKASTDAIKELQDANNAINSNIGGNIITYKESEDAYYIQHGADAVPKKLGSPTPEDVKILKHWYGSGENQSYTFSEDYSLVISFGGVQRHSTSENNVSITDTISSSTAQRIVLENQRSNKKSGLSNSTGTYIISLHTLTVLYTNVSAGDTISHNIGTTNNTTNSGCIIGFK